MVLASKAARASAPSTGGVGSPAPTGERYPGQRLPLPRLPQEPDHTTGAPIVVPEDFCFPFMRLPHELRWKIYRYLYKSHLPVHPTTNKQHRKKRTIIPRTTFPTDFLRTSRQIWTEASQVLWGDNQIVFQFPRIWVGYPSWCDEDDTPNASTFIPRHGMLTLIRNLVVEVYLERSSDVGTPAHKLALPGSTVKKELQQFRCLLGNGHKLQKLEIRFTNISMSRNPNEALAPWPPLKHYSEEKNRDGWCCAHAWGEGFGEVDLSREDMEKLCRQSVDVDQQVLLPLCAIRGVANVKVSGRITPKWAEYLRACISAEKGAVFQPFVQVDAGSEHA